MVCSKEGRNVVIRRDFLKGIAGILLSPLAWAKKAIVKGECRNCGACCENIYLQNLNPTGHEDTDRFLSMLEETKPTTKRPRAYGADLKVFRCRNHDQKGKRCLIHAERPKVCRDFPKYAKSSDELFEGCGYSVEMQ